MGRLAPLHGSLHQCAWMSALCKALWVMLRYRKVLYNLRQIAVFKSHLHVLSSLRLQRSTREHLVMTIPLQPEAWSLWQQSTLRSARLNIQVNTHLGLVPQQTLNSGKLYCWFWQHEVNTSLSDFRFTSSRRWGEFSVSLSMTFTRNGDYFSLKTAPRGRRLQLFS